MKTPEELAREKEIHDSLPDGVELFRQDLYIPNEVDFKSPVDVLDTQLPPQPKIELVVVAEPPPPKPSIWKSWLGKLSREAIGLILISLIKRYLIKPNRPLHNPKED